MQTNKNTEEINNILDSWYMKRTIWGLDENERNGKCFFFFAFVWTSGRMSEKNKLNKKNYAD